MPPLDYTMSCILSRMSVLPGPFAWCRFQISIRARLAKVQVCVCCCFCRSTNGVKCHMLVDILSLHCYRGKRHIIVLQEQCRGCLSPSQNSGDPCICTLHEQWPRTLICMNLFFTSLMLYATGPLQASVTPPHIIFWIERTYSK